MNLQTYESRMAELGINRGNLTAGFPAELGRVVDTRDWHLNYDVCGKRVKPPPIEEDLSHLVKPMRITVFAEMLKRHNTSIAEVARRAGVAKTYVRQCGMKRYFPPVMRAILCELLGAEELERFEKQQ